MSPDPPTPGFARAYTCGTFGGSSRAAITPLGTRPRVRLTVVGETRDLTSVVAASGARYATERGLPPTAA